MTGNLRTDLFEDLCEWEQKSSLSIALGTSLCGMNADRCCDGAYKRHRGDDGVGTKDDLSKNISYGLVLCNLQETAYDEKCVLRIYCSLDKLGMLLEQELLSSISQSIEEEGAESAKQTLFDTKSTYEEDDDDEDDIFFVPYDAITGDRLNTSIGAAASSDNLLRLDLREGAQLRLTGGEFEGDVGEVVGKQSKGHYKIRFKHALKPGATLKMPFERVLGTWWIEQMQKGLVHRIPVVNVIFEY